MSILYEERLDGALPEVDRTSVLMALREHVPGLEILHTDEEIIPYECDGLSAYRTRPLLVVLPKQMEQVTAILAVCHRLRVPGGDPWRRHRAFWWRAAAGKRCVVGDGAL